MNRCRMTRVALTLLFLGSLAKAQHLPSGTYQPNRERTYDIIHYATDLTPDWITRSIAGTSTIRLRLLASGSSFTLDAHRITVSRVRDAVRNVDLQFSSTDSSLTIWLSSTLQPTDTVTVAITHSATPTAGMYFIDPPPGSKMLPSLFTYGEGGLHANWLPIYGTPNDKFSSELSATVAKPYAAVSNGKFAGVRENRDGTRTFHWNQNLPHSDYLIALFVGEYDTLHLRPAFGTIPLTCWVPHGRKEEARATFGNTPAMIEFFSNRFSYRFPWDKYHQAAVYDYAIGAMENTSITGHNDRVLRKPGELEELNPNFESYTSNWTAESVISHELAHHWFGDNLTCRSLASIWLNESFATYLMMLWDEERLGSDQLQFASWLALQEYLKYVKSEHIIRPMEYRYFDSRGEIYNEQTTYLKGGILLDQLRWILGDEKFFRGMSYYLHKHEFSNVESTDLKIALEEGTGENLEWFFDQWVYHGGHPRFEVSYVYLSDRKKVDLTVRQTQALVDGQVIFRLPVEIRIDTKSTTLIDTVWVQNETDRFSFDVDGKPEMVSFDGRGLLVCELLFEKNLSELLYQVKNDATAGRLWALQQLADSHSSNPNALAAIRELLIGKADWWLKAEATLQLQKFGSLEAERLLFGQLKDPDYHVRKTAVIALGSRFTDAARKELLSVVQSDRNSDVAATAIVSLAKIDPTLSPSFLSQQLSRQAWYDEHRVAVLAAAERLADSKFVPIIRDHVSIKYHMAIREQALKSWAACDPADPGLVDALLVASSDKIIRVRATAMQLLGKLKVGRAVPVLEEIRRTDGDGDVRKAASDALEEIARLAR